MSQARPPLPVLGAALAGAAGLVVIAVIVVGLLAQPGDLPAASASPSTTSTSVAIPSATALPTEMPTSTPAPSATASLSPSPSPSTAPTAGPSSTPSGTPIATPPPTASPLPTLGPSRFRLVNGFPAPGEWVAEIIAAGPGFVAVGHVENPTPDCPYRQDGRIWTSADGENWARRDGDALGEARVWGVVVAGSALYAFGYVGVPGDCPVPDGFGNNVWRSTDGIAWERITSGIALVDENDRWNDVAVAGGRLVVVGSLGEANEDELRGGVWISTNGVDWRTASRMPSAYDLPVVAARGNTVVAFGEDPADGLAWYSDDAGDTWRSGQIDSGYLPYTFDLVATHDRFVAVTTACCGVPMQTVGLALTSTDGRTWTTGSGQEAHLYAAQQVVTVPGAFVALTSAGETRLSANGTTWRSGPAGPTLDSDTAFLSAAVGGDKGVVVVGSHPQATSGERVIQTWFAPLTEFNPAAWTQAPLPAAEPVIGESYRYFLYTHCGEENTRVVFDGGIWLVEQIESYGRGFANPEDRGTITMLEQNLARYQSRRGGSILLERATAPPPWPRCA
jgi:hypothetical protein